MAEGESQKIGPLPVWGWALVAGGGIGLIWFMRSKSSTAAAPTTAADTSGTTDPTTIVPVNQGLGADQFNQLLDAIKQLQGEPSEPAGGEDNDADDKPPAPPPAGGGSKPPPPKPTPNPSPKSTKITVPQGSGWSWSSIAARYGHTWRDLWNYNQTPGVRSASSEAELKREGPNHSLFGGTTVYVPAGWKKR